MSSFPLSLLSASEIELFSGVDATENHTSYYFGGTIAWRFRQHRDAAFRLRLVGGPGEYHYQSRRQDPITRVHFIQPYRGDQMFYEMMAGVEYRFGPTIIKAYGGVAEEKHVISPHDVENEISGHNLGAKLLVETWTDLPEGHWLSINSSYGFSHRSYAIHSRLGYRFSRNYSIGLETAGFGNKQYDAVRFGGFIRYEDALGELSVSGGVSGDYEDPDVFYGTLQFLYKFDLQEKMQQLLF